MDCMQVRLVRSIGVVWGHPLGGTGREWELFNGRCGQSEEHKRRGRLTEISLPFCHQPLHITGMRLAAPSLSKGFSYSGTRLPFSQQS